MTALRIGSLFSGAGMLDEGVRAVLGGDVAWHAEVDPAACKVLACRYPQVPNLGDVTDLDWAAVPAVDVLTGGSPCQDVSHAGRRAGMRAGTRSGLWAAMCDAIDILRPALVVWENVRGVLSAEADSALEPCPGCVGDPDDGAVLRALGRVLGDLAGLGYDTRWCGLRAADVGAPHGRFRVFVTAWPAQHPAGVHAGHPITRRSGEAGAVAIPRPLHASGPAADAEPEHGRPRRATPRRKSRTHTEPAGRGRTPAADAAGDGRDERRPQPARLIRRPDAAVSGAVATDAESGADRDDAREVRREAERANDPRGQSALRFGDTAERRGTDLDTGNAYRVEQSEFETDMLGHAQNVPDSRVPITDARPGMVPDALQTLVSNGRPYQEEADGAAAEIGGGTFLGDGQQDRNVLAVDGRESEQVRARQVHGRTEELQGTPLGVRESDWPDSCWPDAGSSLPGASVRERDAFGAGDARGERAAAERCEDPLPPGTPAERRESVREPAGHASVPRLQERSEPTPTPQIEWGPYGPAIARWATVLGRPAPAPTETAPRGGQRLSPIFVEWLMGWPAGWVTDVPGITRNDQLKICGNGVVPQQVATAIRAMLTAQERAA